jgi:hypothetical protein
MNGLSRSGTASGSPQQSWHGIRPRRNRLMQQSNFPQAGKTGQPLFDAAAPSVNITS